jgi:centrosomal protein CEP76
VAQINKEQALRADRARRFHTYANIGWPDDQDAASRHQTRIIKLFARSSDGGGAQQQQQRFVCTFVQPLRAARCLDSPLHAARFVRLIPYAKDVALSGHRREVWHAPHVFLTRRCGDLEDHAALLCSLLLGFGMDAYVCVGTNDSGPHVWVMTRSDQRVATFWESLTGRQYSLAKTSSSSSLPFKRIHCVFNHRQFYANCQVDDAVLATSYNLQQAALWKRFDPQAVAVLPRRQFRPVYAWQQLNCGGSGGGAVPLIREEELLEQKLCALLAEYRKEASQLSTTWDRAFAYVLSTCLTSFEHERVRGEPCANAEFQSAIKHTVPSGYIFKGVPLQFIHRSPTKMLASMLRNADLTRLMATRGDAVRFALRIKIVPYPEQVCAVWCMVAVRYREVTQQ